MVQIDLHWRNYVQGDGGQLKCCRRGSPLPTTPTTHQHDVSIGGKALNFCSYRNGFSSTEGATQKSNPFPFFRKWGCLTVSASASGKKLLLPGKLMPCPLPSPCLVALHYQHFRYQTNHLSASSLVCSTSKLNGNSTMAGILKGLRPSYVCHSSADLRTPIRSSEPSAHAASPLYHIELWGFLFGFGKLERVSECNP
ncbi:hypothetical protein H6P81_011750 [Aristolochia fimbriata]|uniref:Uncharacterized protein n=1 Tax=Aristolochia fimbriata TaxID=158543 RepID=A0AAV7ED42_ARIFI|nr:hypothetical protein H6P81_011750 [Aristolochia fimbriata]